LGNTKIVKLHFTFLQCKLTKCTHTVIFTIMLVIYKDTYVFRVSWAHHDAVHSCIKHQLDLLIISNMLSLIADDIGM